MMALFQLFELKSKFSWFCDISKNLTRKEIQKTKTGAGAGSIL